MGIKLGILFLGVNYLGIKCETPAFEGCENAELSRFSGTYASLLFGRKIMGIWGNFF